MTEGNSYSVEYIVTGETLSRVIPCDNRETAEALAVDLLRSGSVSSVTVIVDRGNDGSTEPAVETPEVKTEKKPFSFRADPERVRVWKIYAQASGMKIEDLCSAAINEYMKNHPLTGNARKLFEMQING